MSEQTDGDLVITDDGSHTVYSSRFDQHYHNPNGAVAESRYVFFQQTALLDDLNSCDQITILEIGFGTGLSLMLLMDSWFDQDSTTHIDYYSVEGFPLSHKMAKEFNFGDHFHHPEVTAEVTDLFANLSEGMNHTDLSEHFSVHLFYGMFEDFRPGQINANYVFHDAFSPDANPELWTGETFKKIYTLCADNVLLSTYSAASIAQGALAWADWHVAKTKGALGKREMLLAAKNPERLGDLKRINEERYARRYAEDDF